MIFPLAYSTGGVLPQGCPHGLLQNSVGICVAANTLGNSPGTAYDVDDLIPPAVVSFFGYTGNECGYPTPLL